MLPACPELFTLDPGNLGRKAPIAIDLGLSVGMKTLRVDTVPFHLPKGVDGRGF
jgi:hypothetical protein